MINIALIDDHQMFREGLKAILSARSDMAVVSENEDGRSFMDQVHDDIDVALLDLDMPGMNGIQVMEALHRSHSQIKVIFVSSNKESTLIASLMALGARGYIHKETGADELIDAILSVNDTGYFFNNLVSRSMLVKLAREENIRPTFNHGESLTEREKEILELICKELTTSEIGEKLFISAKTVENHRGRIMLKTGARNTAGLVVYAIKNKLIDVG